MMEKINYLLNLTESNKFELERHTHFTKEKDISAVARFFSEKILQSPLSGLYIEDLNEEINTSKDTLEEDIKTWLESVSKKEEKEEVEETIYSNSLQTMFYGKSNQEIGLNKFLEMCLEKDKLSEVLFIANSEDFCEFYNGENRQLAGKLFDHVVRDQVPTNIIFNLANSFSNLNYILDFWLPYFCKTETIIPMYYTKISNEIDVKNYFYVGGVGLYVTYNIVDENLCYGKIITDENYIQIIKNYMNKIYFQSNKLFKPFPKSDLNNIICAFEGMANTDPGGLAIQMSKYFLFNTLPDELIEEMFNNEEYKELYYPIKRMQVSGRKMLDDFRVIEIVDKELVEVNEYQPRQFLLDVEVNFSPQQLKVFLQAMIKELRENPNYYLLFEDNNDILTHFVFKSNLGACLEMKGKHDMKFFVKNHQFLIMLEEYVHKKYIQPNLISKDEAILILEKKIRSLEI